MKGGRRQCRQEKRWRDNIKEWTGLEFAKSQEAVENREKWRKLIAKSSVVTQRPSRLRDRWWWWWNIPCEICLSLNMSIWALQLFLKMKPAYWVRPEHLCLPCELGLILMTCPNNFRSSFRSLRMMSAEIKSHTRLLLLFFWDGGCLPALLVAVFAQFFLGSALDQQSVQEHPRTWLACTLRLQTRDYKRITPTIPHLPQRREERSWLVSGSIQLVNWNVYSVLNKTTLMQKRNVFWF